MGRTSLTDGSGLWFDEAASERFDEKTDFNGSNEISRVTGSQWEHQRLYQTGGKNWILHCWSQRDGSSDTYDSITTKDAAVWFSQNDYQDEELPEEVLKLMAPEFDALKL